jgi:hypothetical protein
VTATTEPPPMKPDPDVVYIPAALIDDRRIGHRDRATLMHLIALADNSARCDHDEQAPSPPTPAQRGDPVGGGAWPERTASRRRLETRNGGTSTFSLRPASWRNRASSRYIVSSSAG